MPKVNRFQPAGLALLGMMLATQAGCIGLVSHLLHSAGKDLVPAEYEGLEEQRVAVLTVIDSSKYTDDVAARMVSREVGELVATNVKKVELVREDEVEEWRNRHGWDKLDFLTIGRGVDADKVVAIELNDLKLRDGATLYRGQVNATTTVYDVKTGKREFRRHLDDYSYPVTGGQYTSETTEPKFRRVFLHRLSEVLARYFHPYDFHDSVALDAELL